MRALPRGQVTRPSASAHLLDPALEDGERLLVVRLGRPHRALSWAITGGGFVRTEAVAWRYARAHHSQVGRRN